MGCAWRSLFYWTVCSLTIVTTAYAKEQKWTFGPVDVVYTWVNGSDPLWTNQRNEWAKRTLGASWDATKVTRFRDRNELKYSLRSIQKFAPFVRHIYIVTCGQRPAWLKAHPKISLVSHKDIYLWPEHLPVFNSMSIETHLHRIPNLAERFIYMNDDVFLGAPTTPFSFFTKKGRIRVFLKDSPIEEDPSPTLAGAYRRAAANTRALIIRTFHSDKFCRYHEHTPFPSIQSHTKDVERRFTRVFRTTSSHRFRTQEDYTITNGLVPISAIYLKRGYPCKAYTITYSFRGDAERDKVGLKQIAKTQPIFFCIQDDAADKSPAAERCLSNFFETYFPTKAPWEK